MPTSLLHQCRAITSRMREFGARLDFPKKLNATVGASFSQLSPGPFKVLFLMNMNADASDCISWSKPCSSLLTFRVVKVSQFEQEVEGSILLNSSTV